MLALRTTAGISQDQIHGFEDIIDKNVKVGYLEKTETGYRLSRAGLDFANQVFMDLV